MAWSLRVEFKPADLWVGAFWRWTPGRGSQNGHWQWDLWICIVPMLPLHLRLHQRFPASWAVSSGTEEA